MLCVVLFNELKSFQRELYKMNIIHYWLLKRMAIIFESRPINNLHVLLNEFSDQPIKISFFF